METLLSVLILLVLYYNILNGPGAWAQAVADPGVFLNINCGYSTDIQDPATGLLWHADDKYISTGFNSANVPNWYGFPQLDTLRYFNDSRIPKYCYQMPVVPNITYMVRAEFYYGMYDNANSVPSFQMTIDGLIVGNITNTVDTAYYYEYTYQAQGNATYLCLLRDDSNTNPFISTISLRRIKPYPTMFSTHLSTGYVVQTRNRNSFGATTTPRYPNDVYDRYWFSVNETRPNIINGTSPLTALHTTRSILYAPGNADYDTVPMMVLQSGLTSTGSMTLTLTHRVGNIGFLFLHFAELDPAVNVTSRVFTVTPSSDLTGFATVNIRNDTGMDGEGWFWDDLVFKDRSTETVELVPTAGSVYGPLINACEFFEIIPQVAPVKTVTKDALAIDHIKSSLTLTDWTGDPCLPVPHTWVNCSSLAPPTIQSVNLNNFNLSGTIPMEFNELPNLSALILSGNNFDGVLTDLSLMKGLQILHLQDNNLTGKLPAWLGQLPSLKELYVQNNDFSGPIPPGLLNKSGLVFTYLPGNSLLKNGTAQVDIVTKKTNIWVIVGPILGVGLAALAAAIFFVVYCCVYKKRQPKENLPVTTSSNGNLAPAVGQLGDSRTPNAGGARSFSVAAIAAATQNFTREIGKGGFGPVYYGKLPNGQEVAVKVLDSTANNQGASEFFNEVDILSRVHHRNLVSLLGFCNEGENRMLVYEYLPQGSLRDRLNASKPLGVLDFKARLNIALNAAQGLEYLHTGCNPSIVHRDVKSSNILLTSTKDAAKVGDFGLSRLAAGEDGSVTFVKGTRGYIDPEYVNSQFLTTKSDVFSFGVVLLELLTGRLPFQQSSQAPLMTNHAWTLCDWVRTTLQSGSDADQILDPNVKACRPIPEAVWTVADIAMRCVEPKSVHRPSMGDVVQELRAALALEEGNPLDSYPPPTANFTRRVQHSPSTDYTSGGFSSADMSWPAPR